MSWSTISGYFLLSFQGANSHGQLGLGYVSEMVDHPVNVPHPFPGGIKLLAGGGGHSLIVTKKGQLLSSGWNNKGQLGLGDTNHRCEFEKVSLELNSEEEILQLSCGWDTSAVVTSHGRVFIFGGNSFQQLGLEDRKVNILRPRVHELPGGHKVLSVHLSMRHMVIQTQDRIYISGRSDSVKEMRKIGKEEGPFVYIAHEGQGSVISSGQHHFIYSQGPKVIGLGRNNFHQSQEITFPSPVQQLRSGWTHNACLSESGDVYLWGRNNYGQCGTGKETATEKEPLKLNVPEEVQEIHLGAEHGLAVTQSGKIFTWGWNEHGNCGDESVENVLIPKCIQLSGRAVNSCCGSGFCLVVVDKDKCNQKDEII